MNTRQQHMDYRAWGSALLLLFAAAFSLPLYGQYSAETFNLKAASELYDERGFDKGQVINVDGNFAVSSVNGSASYSYILDKFTKKGYGFHLSLNYCGSVSLTSFKNLTAGTASGTFNDGNIDDGGSHVSAKWVYMTRNHPMWIMGINGFAVQTLSLVADYLPPDYDNTSTWQGSRVPWLVDGYDFCNRMTDMVSAASTEYDVIRLLRSDGSLLELRNEHFALEQDNGIERHELVTGHYFEDAVNPRGFAVVEYDTVHLNGRDRAAYVQAKSTHGAEWVNAVFPFMPRRVRYYPGDGLEYVFFEEKMPYGAERYTEDARIAGAERAGPTIFYLREINDGIGNVLDVRYTRHMVAGDGTPGRALLRGIGDNIELSYADSYVLVEGHGRTTSLLLAQQIPLSEYVHQGGTGKQSYIGNIAEIRDPEDRRTSFAYKDYQRNFIHYKHPYDDVLRMEVKGMRLSRITEPSLRRDLSYYEGASNDIDADLPTPYAVGMVDWRLTNAVTSVKRYFGSELLATETYCFRGMGNQWGSECDGIAMPGTIYTLKDERTGRLKTTEYNFQKYEINRYNSITPPHALAIPLVYTAVTGVVETADGIERHTATWYDSVGRRTMMLPVRTEVSIGDGSSGYVTGHTTYQYQTDTALGFGGSAEVRSLHTRRVTQQKERIHNPANPNEILAETITKYLHLPFRGDTTVSQHWVYWQKFASLARYFSLREQGLAPYRWEDMPDSLQYFDTVTVGTYNPPPVFDLVEESYVLDGQGVYMGGKKNVWNTQAAVEDNLYAYHRGLLLRDSVIGKDRNSAVLGGAYTYEDDRLLAGSSNAYGAQQRFRETYKWWDGKGKAVHDDGTEAQHNLIARRWQLGVEKPMLQQQMVRNAATGSTDTLEQLSEWTFWGRLAAQRDANGYYSKFDYDKNGRLTTAWLPKDFINPQSADVCIEHFDGIRELDLVGETHSVQQWDTVKCNNSNGEVFGAFFERSTWYGALQAGITLGEHPCGGTSGGMAAPSKPAVGKREQTNPHVLVNANVPIPYVSRKTETILIPFQTSGNIFDELVSLRKLELKLTMATMVGKCFTMQVRLLKEEPSGDTTVMEEFWSNMNCTYTGNAQSIQGKGEQVLSGAPYYGYTLDLTSRAQEFIDAGNGIIEISVPTVGAWMSMVTWGEDQRPRLVLDGEFDIPNPLADYTVQYKYDGDERTTVRVKTDDANTTFTQYPPGCQNVRHSEAYNTFGAEHTLTQSVTHIGDPANPVRSDDVRFHYTGIGLRDNSTDQLNYQTTTDYDAWGRPTKVTNPDGSYSTITYSFGDPLQLVGDNDQNFYGYCEKVETAVFDASNTQENTSAVFSDAFGRKRREAVGANLAVQTKYEYDNLNRLTTVVNPEGDTTRYWYDDFGRVRYKHQPDMGYTSYAYDKLGQVRLAQTQQQHAEGTLTFTEYDDLGRVTLVGEAKLVQGGGGGGHGVAGFGGKKEQGMSFPPHPAVNLNRLTDQISGAVLNDGGISTTPTANKTVWLQPSTPVPSFWDMSDLTQSYCAPPTMVGTPVFPYLTHGVQPNDDPGLPTATPTTFENISLYPQNGRIAIVYDALPTAGGSVWAHFPAQAQWNALAPTGTVRNLKGHEVAVAYRTHAGEPYHFVVMSYDERGRVEALLRYTENLGFDAVYYTYNALNAVTSVRAVDAMRQHTTWYGYDWNGRVDSVWTYLTPAGQGLGISNPAYPAAVARPNTADIVYTYSKRGQVASMAYPPANAAVQYAYNSRRFLDTMLATKNGAQLFTQILRYDAQGLITRQEAQHSGQTPSASDYAYQNGTNFLTAFVSSGNGGWNQENYSYDNVGNRLGLTMPMGGVPQTQEYQYADANGPNRLSKLVRRDLQGSVIDETNYSYNASGAMNSRVVSANGSSTSESYAYDNVQGLVKKYTLQTGGVTGEWRYRYSAAGEREQKRQYQTQGVLAPKEWVYYLLDGSKRQLAVYKGAEVAENTCGYFANSWSPRVFIAPEEYLSYGIGDVHNITIRPNDPNTSRKEYKIQDHLGNTRVVLDGYGAVIGQYDYKPFGGVLWQSAPTPRLSFIDKEKDAETGLSNFGVRNYDDGIGRFMSVDVLWEKYRSLTPYQYSANNPLILKDPSGKAFGITGAFQQSWSNEDMGSSPPVEVPTQREREKECKICHPPKGSSALEESFKSSLEDVARVPSALGGLGMSLLNGVLGVDAVRFGGAGTVITGLGGSVSAEGTFIQPEGHGVTELVSSSTTGVGAGFDVSGGGFFGMGWFSGKDEDLTAETLAGRGYSASGGGGSLLGAIGLFVSYAPTKDGDWTFIGVTVGPSLTPVNANVQVEETVLNKDR